MERQREKERESREGGGPPPTDSFSDGLGRGDVRSRLARFRETFLDKVHGAPSLPHPSTVKAQLDFEP